MLVLSRKIGETLYIGEDIKITINRIAGNRVTVGVEAPRDLRIIRGELERFTTEPSGSTAPMAAEAELELASSLAK